MPGHPSVKKRQKEQQRKERQAEKATKRDERRGKDKTADNGELVLITNELGELEFVPASSLDGGEAALVPDGATPEVVGLAEPAPPEPAAPAAK
jgi:hypothetical protein